ncbi:MAG: M67 family metallopeptidase [Acidobacteria bacterium]|nr:M67 family metallopeptidase [Acidobacteriota bacterium]
MLRIEPGAWEVMVSHARAAYPNECCGAMLGAQDGELRVVTRAVPLENAFQGEQSARYELRSEDLLRADAEARRLGMDLIGIFHSHPDCDAYFSATDLKNSCPWYSFLVLSIQRGEFARAASFRPDFEQTAAPEEELEYPAQV